MFEKFLYVFPLDCISVFGQAVEEDLPISCLRNTVIQQGQHPAIRAAADQASKSLLQRDGRLWNLIAVEGIPAIVLDRGNPSFDNGIAGYGERQFIDDDATQLLARHVHAL